MEDSEYSASEYRRFPDNYWRGEVNRKRKAKQKKVKWFLAASSIFLMLSLGASIYLNHHDIILRPFMWTLLQLTCFLLFFLLGVFTTLLNAHSKDTHD